MGASGSPATCAAACRSGRVRAGRRWLAGPPDPRPRRSRCRAPRMRCRPWRPGVSVLVGAIQGARLIHQGGVVFNVGVVKVGRCFGGTRHATRPRWCPRSLHKAWEGPTSTDRAVLAARPARSRASRIAASFTEIGHVVVGRHLQQFARHPVGSFLDALPRFAFHLRRLGSVKIAHVGRRGARRSCTGRRFSYAKCSVAPGGRCVPTGR